MIRSLTSDLSEPLVATALPSDPAAQAGRSADCPFMAVPVTPQAVLRRSGVKQAGGGNEPGPARSGDRLLPGQACIFGHNSFCLLLTHSFNERTICFRSRLNYKRTIRRRRSGVAGPRPRAVNAGREFGVLSHGLTSACAILALMMASEVAAIEKAIPLGMGLKAAADPAADEFVEKAEQLARSGDSAGLAAWMASLKGDSAVSPAVRERLLYESTKAAAQLSPGPRLQQEVQRLEYYRSETLVWTDEHGHREYRPLYDVAAASRQTQRVWAMEQARSDAMKAIRSGDPAWTQRYGALSDPERTGVIAAFSEVAADALPVYQPVLLMAMKAGQPVGELALVVASRTLDTTLMSEVLSKAPPDVALRAVEQVLADDWSGQSLYLLTIAARRPETASASLLAIARVVDREPSAIEMLFSTLGSPHGASAAAALARVENDTVSSRLADVLWSDRDLFTRRHALLALRLTESAESRAILREYAHNPAAREELVAEIPSWLRD